MSFEDNPDDDRYQLDQCIDEIKSLQEQLLAAIARAEAAEERLKHSVKFHLPSADGACQIQIGKQRGGTRWDVYITHFGAFTNGEAGSFESLDEAWRALESFGWIAEPTNEAKGG